MRTSLNVNGSRNNETDYQLDGMRFAGAYSNVLAKLSITGRLAGVQIKNHELLQSEMDITLGPILRPLLARGPIKSTGLLGVFPQ